MSQGSIVPLAALRFTCEFLLLVTATLASSASSPAPFTVEEETNKTQTLQSSTFGARAQYPAVAAITRRFARDLW